VLKCTLLRLKFFRIVYPSKNTRWRFKLFTPLNMFAIELKLNLLEVHPMPDVARQLIWVVSL
jgi:hypothetical protein